MSLVPGFRKPGAGRFYYPRKGYGQISEAIAEAARGHGVNIELSSSVGRIELGAPHKVSFSRNTNTETIEADHVWSTIPLTVFARALQPAAPAEVIAASKNISYRAMVLIYLVLEQPQWTPFDAHYFPEIDVKLTRLSEPKNYSAADEPNGRTVLCGELPCSVGDEIWNATDSELAELTRESLKKCGLPITSRISEVVTKRLPFAYPIYLQGYERYFELQDKWVSGLDRVLTFGRHGLFAHDNTHHALAMSYGAVDCLDHNGMFDRDKWRAYRMDFAKHVVED